jgi:bacterial/archaeal transporter family protein
MKPQIYALLTAVAWGVGGYFEKKGMLLGKLSPQVGITIRTSIAFIILTIISLPQLKSIGSAGSRSLTYMIVGGGILAGVIGMLCFYAAIRGADLSKVMPIAFTSPLFGALMGIIFSGEVVSVQTIIGMIMTVGGIILLTFT